MNFFQGSDGKIGVERRTVANPKRLIKKEKEKSKTSRVINGLSEIPDVVRNGRLQKSANFFFLIILLFNDFFKVIDER